MNVILFAPPGTPPDMIDSAWNWIAANGYPAPGPSERLVVPGPASLLIIPDLAMLASRARFLDLVFQTMSAGGNLVVVRPAIDLRPGSVGSNAQIAALQTLAQLPNTAALPSLRSAKADVVPFVEAPPVKQAVPAAKQGGESAKLAEELKTVINDSDAERAALEERARAHAEIHGSGQMARFAAANNLTLKEASVLLARYNKKEDAS